jgi:HlyD family secretion protein
VSPEKLLFGRIPRKFVRLGVTLVVLVVAGTGAALAMRGFRGPAAEIPTVRVKKGTLDLKVYTTGELRPARSAALMAPSVGGTLQIVHLPPPGTIVKSGDVVVQFDPSEQEYNLEQSEYDLKQAEQQIIKMKADSTVQAAQDQVDLLTAKYDVRKAELEVSKNELLSAIDAKKNDLNLEEAKRRLAQLQEDMKSRQASNDAQLAVLEEQRNHAKLTITQAQTRIDSMTLRATMDGLLTVKDNADSVGGWIPPGMTVPEYRVGDQVSPGRMIGEVLEVSEMEILSKVSETERANLNPGQAAEIRVDARPDEVLHGKVKMVAGMASRGWGPDPTPRFDATFQLDQPDSKLRPGVTAQVIIVGNQVRDALYLPRQALFEKDGKPIVYVKVGSRFEAREVKIKNRSESRTAIDGLPEGTEVALVNPELDANKKGAKPGGAAGPMGVGGGSR